MVKDLINEAYVIANEYPDQWKIKMAEWLTLSNKTLPRISNQCSHKPLISREDKTTYASGKIKDPCQVEREVTTLARSDTYSSTSGGSGMMSSSSCMTCSGFDGDETCLKKPVKEDSGILLFKAKTTKTSKSSLSISKVEEQEIEHEEDIEWVEIFEDEAGLEENDDIVKIESGEIKLISETDMQPEQLE